MLNKVPEVTIYFWVIKILATTVGESAADFLNTTLGFGLTGTSIAMTVILAAVLVAQFRARRYLPTLYWSAVVLISIVGTLISDNLTDNLGVPLEVSTAVFALTLAVTFTAWYAKEKTLSIRSVDSSTREAYYWLAVLFTFALGTSAGDLLSERLDLGYLRAAAIFGAAIAVVALARYAMRLNLVLAFWVAYVLTRPFGASIGDYLSQASDDGGIGLGTVATSGLFLTTIVGVVAFLSWSKRDVAIAARIPAPDAV